MKHSIVFKETGVYGAFPVLNHLQDGHLTIGFSRSTFHDHHAVGDWTVLVSADEGDTWAETDDPTLPAAWPGSSTRERSDRFAGVMDDGSYVCAGKMGAEVWPVSREEEANRRGLWARAHPQGDARIVVNLPTLFLQRSEDGGRTWRRREWDVPGLRGNGFSRPTVLRDGAILAPVYGTAADGAPRVYVWRGVEGGRTWRLYRVGSPGGESAFLEVEPGRVLCLSRTDHGESGGYLVQIWSEDGGITWSETLTTEVWTPRSPPHLIRLRDGRVLLTHGYRAAPMGIRAVFSRDGGRSWDVDDTVVLRDDGGYVGEMPPRGSPESDVGYPHSTQLSDGSVLTVYYITLEDGITHIASTRWDP